MADDRKAIEALERELATAYQRAEVQIATELAAIADEPRLAARRRRLKELAREVDGLTAALDAEARSWVTGELREVYRLGATYGAASSGSTFAWATVHTAAVSEIANTALGDLLGGTAHVRSDVKRLVRASTREAVLDKLLLGRTAVQAGRGLAAELAKHSVSAVVYKNGARHLVGDYSDMVMRTTTATAYNVGTLKEATRAGRKYVVVLDGVGCGWTGHRSGGDANGRVVTIEEAMEHPLSHPRCRRTFTAIPAKTAAEAKKVQDSGDFKPTAEQIADARQADAERVTAQRQRRARLAARDRRLQRRAERIANRGRANQRA